MPTSRSEHRWLDTFLAWYFVTVWGSGYLATKVGLQYAALVAWRSREPPGTEP